MANVGPGTVTISSTVGPGLTATATVLQNVISVAINLSSNTIRIMTTTGLQYFDYSAMTTVTWSISGGATSVTIS